MVQQTFTDMEYANRNRTTKREAFLDAMESIIPWKEWMELIAPFYVQKERGRKLIPLETMLRMYLMQNWFGLSDEGIEDAIYDSYAMKRFLKIDFSIERTPDATTLLHFRHLLEKHDITRKMFDDVKERLDNAGLIMHGGTIVDATIIHLVDCDYPLFISDSIKIPQTEICGILFVGVGNQKKNWTRPKSFETLSWPSTTRGLRSLPRKYFAVRTTFGNSV